MDVEQRVREEVDAVGELIDSNRRQTCARAESRGKVGIGAGWRMGEVTRSECSRERRAGEEASLRRCARSPRGDLNCRARYWIKRVWV